MNPVDHAGPFGTPHLSPLPFSEGEAEMAIQSLVRESLSDKMSVPPVANANSAQSNRRRVPEIVDLPRRKHSICRSRHPASRECADAHFAWGQ